MALTLNAKVFVKVRLFVSSVTENQGAPGHGQWPFWSVSVLCYAHCLKHKYSSFDQVQSPNLVITGTVTSFSLESSCHVKTWFFCISLQRHQRAVCIGQAISDLWGNSREQLYWKNSVSNEFEELYLQFLFLYSCLPKQLVFTRSSVVWCKVIYCSIFPLFRRAGLIWWVSEWGTVKYGRE